MLNGIELVKSRKSNVNEKMISSLEVAEMVGREHNEVLKDIRRIVTQLGEGNLPQSYFTESFYLNKQNKKLPSFLLSKKGCELYGTRMTGEKGTLFAVRYIERFNEMENELQFKLPATYSEALIELAMQVKATEELEMKVEEQKPKVLLAESIENSHSLILVGELAKILKQNGFDIGQNRLYERLRDMGYLVKSGASKNSPTQRSMELGLFRVVEGTRTNDKGVNITKTTKVTGKGQKYFINKFLKEIN